MRPSIPVLLAAVFLLSVSALDGGETLRLKVSPAVSRAPGLLTVRLNIAAAPDNRFVQVVAESPDFYTSSQVPVTGEETPVRVVEFRNLPTGVYQVTGVLVGVHGPKGMASGIAKIVASVGSLQ